MPRCLVTFTFFQTTTQKADGLYGFGRMTVPGYKHAQPWVGT